MGAFLLLVFVLASQVIGGFNTKLPPPAYGNSITILSIDGGGIKGIIPSVVLQRLEQILKVNATYLYLYVKMMHDYGVIFLMHIYAWTLLYLHSTLVYYLLAVILEERNS